MPKTKDVKTRQVTVFFNVGEDALHEGLYTKLETAAKAVALPLPEFLMLCANWGFEEAKAKAQERYDKIRSLGMEAWGPQAPAPADDTATKPADGGNIIEKCKHPGTCKDCQGDVAAGTRIRHFPDGSIRCKACEAKAAA